MVFRKRFGQNFLRDGNVKRRIVDFIAPKTDDHFVEIGPGDGALTFLIAPLVARFDAVEIDRDLVAKLKYYENEFKNFHLHEADALEFDFSKLYQKQKFRLVGNLPYNISTPLLFHLLKFLPQIQDINIMLQKEVAERILAKPNSKQYGRLSVMLQYYLQGEILVKVSRNSFYPPPKVLSAFLSLVPKERSLKVKDDNFFAGFVKAAFSTRRKTLRNALKSFLDAEQLGKLGEYGSRRAEQLSVEEFVRLSNEMN